MSSDSGLETQSRCHEPQRRGAEVEQLLVEALVGVLAAPRRARPVAQAKDLELAPRVAAVGGIERGPGRLAAGGRALEVGVLLESAGGFVHRHLPGVQT